MKLNLKYANVKQLKEAGYTRKKLNLWWYKPNGTYVYTHPEDECVYYYQFANRNYKRTAIQN